MENGKWAEMFPNELFSRTRRKLCSEEFSVPPTVSPVSQCMMGNNSGVASVASAACTFLLLYARNNSESIMLFQCDIENILSVTNVYIPLYWFPFSSCLPSLISNRTLLPLCIRKHTPARFRTFPSHVFQTKKM